MDVAAREGRRFGKYTLVARLATGGMAEIFMARLQGAGGFEKLVCIKRILPQFAKDRQFVGMFLAEAKIAAQITHPNVCQVFELGEIEGQFFIAMEYLEGVPLTCFRRRDMYPPPPDCRLVAGLAVQACEGLHHAHQLKRPDGTPLEVVHRDVSGNNLFATVDGIIKVLDFGIAKVQDASVKTSTGSVKGTYAYMAPEQLRGERLDRRTDVFALGTVVWELFARRHLFRRDTDFLTFEAIMSEPIPDICEIRPDVPPAVADALASALARDRERRFPSARMFGEALTRAVMPLGGPLPPSAIAEEIERSFEPRLDQQRQLIRIAREGGALGLDDDIGPQVGHGTELMTTPISIVSGLQQRDPIQYSAIDTGESVPGPIPSPARQSNRLDSVPVVVIKSKSRTAAWIVAMVAVAALAAVLAIILTRPPPPARIAAPARDAAPSVIAVVEVIADAAIADAAIAEPPPSAPVADPEGRSTGDRGAVDAAPPMTRVDEDDEDDENDKRARRRSDRDRQRHKPDHTDDPDPSRPPGFITIDSTPVYATIYIDGKRIGDTPLVRIKLAPGKHTVKARSPSGTTKKIVIEIESGKVAPARRIEW